MKLKVDLLGLYVPYKNPIKWQKIDLLADLGGASPRLRAWLYF